MNERERDSKHKASPDVLSDDWMVKSMEGMIVDSRRWLAQMNPVDAARLKAELKKLSEEK